MSNCLNFEFLNGIDWEQKEKEQKEAQLKSAKWYAENIDKEMIKRTERDIWNSLSDDWIHQAELGMRNWSFVYRDLVEQGNCNGFCLCKYMYEISSCRYIPIEWCFYAYWLDLHRRKERQEELERKRKEEEEERKLALTKKQIQDKRAKDAANKHNSSNNYKVYRLHFPDGKVYIGITCRDVEDRWREGKGYQGQAVYKAIQKYGWHNIEANILFKNLSKRKAMELERVLIKTTNEENYNVK